MTTLGSREFCQSIRGRLGLMPEAQFSLVEGPIHCRGGCSIQSRKVDIKQVPQHLGLHCKLDRRGPLTVAHDGAAQVLCMIADRNGVPFEWTPYLDDGRVLDVGFSFPDVFVGCDVTLRAADAPCYAGLAARKGADGVLQAADNSKDRRYKAEANGRDIDFVPLSFLNSGAYGKPVGVLLKRLCQAGADNGVARPVDLKTAREWLAVAIARGRGRAAVSAAARMRAVTPAYKAAIAARRRNRARRLVQGGRYGEG